MCAMKEPLIEFDCLRSYGKSVFQLSNVELELSISKQVGVLANEDQKNTNDRSCSITKINKTVGTNLYDSGILNACSSSTSPQMAESHSLIKETIDKICTKMEALHLDDFEEHKNQQIKHFIQKWNSSNSVELGHCEILQKKIITGRKRKVQEMYGKISSQQLDSEDEFVAERTELVHNSLNGVQYLDDEIEISDHSRNKKIEIKTLIVSTMMSELASKYKSISPSNAPDLATPISSIASVAIYQLSFSSNCSTASETLSPSENKSSNTCIAKSQSLLKSKSSFSSNKIFFSVSTSKSQSSITSKSQDTFKTKSSFSKHESFSASTTKSPYYKKHPSPSVSTTKSQSASKTNSSSMREFSKLRIAKSQAAPITKFSSLKSESLRTSTGHPFSSVLKKSYATMSNERYKKQRTRVLKSIQQKITSLNADPTKSKMLENTKKMGTNRKLASKIERHQIINSSNIRKFKECKKVKINAKRMVPSIKFVIKNLQSSCTSIIYLLPQNKRKEVLVAENATHLDSTVDATTKTKSELKNTSVSQNKTAKSILNSNSKCSPRKRIVYDENKEEQRRRTMKVIKEKQKLLKDKIMVGKYSHNKNIKNKLIIQAKAIQSEIDKHFRHLEELGKMPNHHPKQKQLVKPKVRKMEYIRNFQSLLQHLTGKVATEVNLENIHEYINYETVKEAFYNLQKRKRKLLEKIETAKDKMNCDLQNFDNFLKLNRENIFSGATFPNIHTTDNISSLCDSLRKAAESNLKYLISLRFLASNLSKSVRNYRIAEKSLFEEWNSFVFKDHESFFTLRKVR